jgi:hypothetical protein
MIIVPFANRWPAYVVLHCGSDVMQPLVAHAQPIHIVGAREITCRDVKFPSNVLSVITSSTTLLDSRKEAMSECYFQAVQILPGDDLAIVIDHDCEVGGMWVHRRLQGNSHWRRSQEVHLLKPHF